MTKTLQLRPYVISAIGFGAPFLRRSLPSPPSKPSLSPIKSFRSLAYNYNLVFNAGVSFSSSSKSHRLASEQRRNLCIRATQVNDSGSIDSSLIHSMEKKIKEQLNADVVVVKDAYGDGRHVSIDVVSTSFEGQSAVNRQRMVYRVIWEELQSTVHAVDQMTTKTPTEAAEGR